MQKRISFSSQNRRKRKRPLELGSEEAVKVDKSERASQVVGIAGAKI